VRLAIAAVFSAVWTALIWVFPIWIDWEWLLEHENELAIRALAQATITTAGIGLSLWSWKILIASIAPLIPLLGLLGSSQGP